MRTARKLRTLVAYRRAALASPRLALRYLLHDREVTNFTYDLANENELVSFVAGVLGRSRDEVEGYVREVAADSAFLEGIARKLRENPDRNGVPRFGRRLGWYAIVRCLKPHVVVETGVHDGLGSALLLRALERNAADGVEGRLMAFDMDPRSGWLVDDPEGRFDLIIGDVRKTLSHALDGVGVGVFIHDSLHTYEHERFEFESALEHAAVGLVLISDNAHESSALEDVSRERGFSYAFFRERPLGHFYPGAGIGLATPYWSEEAAAAPRATSAT